LIALLTFALASESFFEAVRITGFAARTSCLPQDFALDFAAEYTFPAFDLTAAKPLATVAVNAFAVFEAVRPTHEVVFWMNFGTPHVPSGSVTVNGFPSA
jgi:hypothetical protein